MNDIGISIRKVRRLARVGEDVEEREAAAVEDRGHVRAGPRDPHR